MGLFGGDSSSTTKKVTDIDKSSRDIAVKEGSGATNFNTDGAPAQNIEAKGVQGDVTLKTTDLGAVDAGIGLAESSLDSQEALAETAVTKLDKAQQRALDIAENAAQSEAAKTMGKFLIGAGILVGGWAAVNIWGS